MNESTVPQLTDICLWIVNKFTVIQQLQFTIDASMVKESLMLPSFH